MRLSARGNVVVETVAVGVRVMRFTRPDVRQHLDNDGKAGPSPLFREIQNSVLAELPTGWTLVVNLGLLDGLGAALYRCLLEVRQGVWARGGRLVLCCLGPRLREAFELVQGPRVFTVFGTEAAACRHGELPKADAVRGGGAFNGRGHDRLEAVSG
jgi:anti-anti-sigma regulatory factor